MHALYEQGKRNKVHLEMISMKDAHKIDNMVRGYGEEVIWSPHTSVIDTKLILNHMVKEIERINPNFKMLKGTQYLKLLKKEEGYNEVLTNNGEFQ